jgi:signal peptide peptidase SppA
MKLDELRAAIASSFDARPSLVYAPCAGQVVLHNALVGGDDKDEVPESVMQCASAFGVRDVASKPFVFRDGVAIIPIYGTLLNRLSWSGWGYTGHQFIRNQFDQAIADPDVKGIVFDVNSYGGSVYGNFELAAYIRQHRKTKPSLAVVDSMAFSGAYSLASAAGRMVISPMGDAGSIGVVMMHVDYSKAMKELGVKVSFVYAGEHKVDGNPYEPLPEDVRADMQASVDYAYQEFVSTVVKNRGMSEKAVRETEARIFSAAEAERIGLVDDVMPPNEAFASFFNELSGSSSNGKIIMSKQTEAEKNAAAEQERKEKEAAEQAAAEKEAAAKAEAEKQAAAAQAAAAQPTAEQIAANERARIAGILSCEEAKGRETLALHLATKTSMSVDEAKAALAAAPKAEKSSQGSPFERAMENGNPEVSAGSGEPPGDKSNRSASIAASYAKATGVKIETKH